MLTSQKKIIDVAQQRQLKKKCSASPMAPTKHREKSQPPLVWLPFHGSWEWPNQEDSGALTKSCKIVVSIALLLPDYKGRWAL